MRRRRPLLAVAALGFVLALPGCGIGSDDAGGGSEDSDKRAVALACLEEEEVAARLDGEEGDEEIVIGESADADAPRIRFFLTSGESEAAQFEGDGEGAEQIGPTLLYVNGGSDDLLETVEGCLADL